MKKSILKVAVLTAFLSVLLASCGGIGGQEKSKKNSSNKDPDDAISGDLTTETTWAGKDANGESITYYINGTYTVKDGGKLTIEEGAIVKLGAGSTLEVNIGGTLVATGTIFTSAKDSRGRKISSAGQDAPAPADWKQLNIYGGHAELYNCEISYGGSSCSTVEVKKRNSTFGSCRVDGCLFTHNDGTKSVASIVKAALHYSSYLSYNDDNAVTNTTFENNVWPISLPVSFSVKGSNHFGTGDKANTYNLIHLYENNINTDVVWEHQEVPYLYAFSDVLYIGTESSSSGKLTIKGGPTPEDKTVVEVYQKKINIMKKGTLCVEDNILFTNCEYTPNTKYPGLYCRKAIEWHVGNSRYTEDYAWLQSNASMNVIIENDVPTESAYTGDNSANRKLEIIGTNVYSAINY